MVKPIRIGLIGVSHRATIAERWQDDGRATIAAGCDVVPDCLKAFQESYGRDTHITADYRKLVKRDDLDAIAIFTPDNLHAEHAVAALQAGKHVFLEKPMAITIDGCERIRAAEQLSGRKLMIGFNCRYMPYFNIMKDIIDRGDIGEVKAVWVRHFVGFGGWAYFHDYRANRKGSTSLLLQKASHDIDLIHYLTGQHTNRVVGMGNLGVFGGDKPNTLTCDHCEQAHDCPDFSERDDALDKRKCCYRKEVDVEDMSMLMMDLSGNVQASYVQCHYTPDSWRNYTVIGTKGRIESNADDTITLYTQKHNNTRRNPGFSFSRAVFEVGKDKGGHGGADTPMCRAFLDYLIDDIPPRATSHDGLMAVTVGVKGAESLRNGNSPRDIQAKQNHGRP